MISRLPGTRRYEAEDPRRRPPAYEGRGPRESDGDGVSALQEAAEKWGRWVVLLAVVAAVASFWCGYRREVRMAGAPPQPAPAAEQTASPSPEHEEGGAGDEAKEDAVEQLGAYVVVKVDKLNMRAEPSTSARIIRQLPAGIKLRYLETSAGWYRVLDDAGNEGWVAAGSGYSELVEP